MNKRVKSFSMVNCDPSLTTDFMPIEPNLRKKLYEEYSNRGTKLPDYSLFSNAKDLDKIDIMCLRDKFDITFRFMGHEFHLEAKAGLCLDFASVPAFLQFDRVSKLSQYSAIPALVHDCLYACKYFERKYCDDVFEALLRWKKVPFIEMGLYVMAVRIGGHKPYERDTNKISPWFLGYNNLYMDDLRLTEFSRFKFK